MLTANHWLRAIHSLAAAILMFILITGVRCKPATITPTQEGNWIQSAQIGKFPRSNAISFVIGNKAYVGTGFNETVQETRNRLIDLWSFTTDSGWMQEADFPGPPRSNAAAFSIGNFGYVGTGFDGVNAFNDFYQYDPQSDSWTRTIGTSGDFTKRRGAVAFVYRDKAYIVTGSASGSMARDFWVFDPSQSAPWHRLNDITNDNTATFDDGYADIERENAVAFINGDSAYITLGRNGSVLSSTWVYDFARDRWGQRSPYHRQARFGAVAFTISGRSFVGTGNSGSNTTFDDFDEFMPYAVFNAND
jgi:N-acetylneuraminic acid mutarotase